MERGRALASGRSYRQHAAMRSSKLAPAALAALAVATAGCGSGSPAQPTAAHRLAEADGLDPGDASLAAYRVELARLQRVCTEPPGELADRAIAGRDHLHELNIPDSSLAVLRDAADLATGRGTTRRRSCATDFADALTGLEQNGR
jgi:hypothetical protein